MKEDIKTRILEANAAYRAGNASMSDAEFDALLDEFKLQYPDEYDEFRDILNEGAIEHGTKVKHPYVMGSLNKVTIEKPDEIFKFIKKHITSCINVSAKVDGISCRLHYENGKLTQASTRGDGEQGTDLTDKITYVKNVPTEIEFDDAIDVRGELVILKDDFATLEGFANARNACAGIMNKKYYDKTEVAKVSFVAYTILGRKYPKDEQFTILKNNGFYTAWYNNYTSYFYSKPEFIDKLTEDLVREHHYDTDGLVISDSTYYNEEKYRPDAAVAVKGNMNSAITKIIDVEWRGPSKDGKFVPVAQLEPVQLCGTTVSQATMNNLDFIAKFDLKYGTIVKIQKRGEIIPAIVEVVSNVNTTDLVIPTECPCCGRKLVIDGPFVWCKNHNCQDQLIKRITLFIKKLGVKNASEATLKSFRVDSFEKLVSFTPNAKYKSQLKLREELDSKVFTKPRKDLLAATNFEDLSEASICKIVDFYGFDAIEAGKYVGLPNGIGEITLDKFKECIVENIGIVNMFINDSRYHVLDAVHGESRVASVAIGSVCFTGKLNTMTRSDASKLAEQNGFSVLNAVKRGLTYLVTNDTSSGSSKNKRAKELGIKVLSEDEFLKLMKSQSTECDIDCL